VTSATKDQLGITMKRSRNCWIFLLGILLVLGGQAFAATQDIKAEPGTGLAFGAFDITESDLAVSHVVLLRIRPTKMYMGSSGEKKDGHLHQWRIFLAQFESRALHREWFFLWQQVLRA
jgi:hypothetical protein